jgi:hypothetical protein
MANNEKRFTTYRETTKVYLNTWGAYNEGCIGYGWFDPAEARDFIEENPERDGGEWFIADIDNYLGVEFGKLEYCSVDEILDSIEALEELTDYELAEVVAVMEYTGKSAQEALDDIDDYICYCDIDAYHESCDELLDFSGSNEIFARYFDYDAYHRDCDFDIYEASNGVCIVAY